MKNFKNIKSWTIIVLSLSFSLSLIFGFSYLIKNDWSLIFGNFINFIISMLVLTIFFIIIKDLLKQLYCKLNNLKFKNNKSSNKFLIFFNNHILLCSLIIILICWLPYIIAFYPGILSPDPSFQIKQFFDIPNKYSTYVNLIDKNVIITNHHPYLHTLLLGNSIKLGMKLINFNFGIFIYSFIQIMILSITLSSTIKYLKRIGLPNVYLIILLLIYSIVPVFPLYAMSVIKDVIFSSLIIIFIMILYDLINIKKSITFTNMIKIMIIMLLISLFRNNGIFVLILSFPLLFFLKKRNILKLSIIFIGVISLYYSYDKILLPILKITPTSIREALSIPFQQTARYVKYYNHDVTKEEKIIIDKILDYETLSSRYNPEKSDPVKNKFNKDTTKNELKDYFNVWINQFIKHPPIYIEATIHNTYGYFCPLKTNWYIYYKFNDTIVEDGFDYHYNSMNITRKILSKYGLLFPSFPVIGLLVNIGFNVWIMMIMGGYLIYKKKIKYLIYLTPAFIVLLVCIASPVNTYFRYALPFIFGMGLMIGIFVSIIRKKEVK